MAPHPEGMWKVSGQAEWDDGLAVASWRYGIVWYGVVWYGYHTVVWYGMVWYGMVWYGMVWLPYYGMVWYGMVAAVSPDGSPDRPITRRIT